jgi:nucleoside-diphosphate-sugar epimerase/phosphohistidine swiveling domain-containing protein
MRVLVTGASGVFGRDIVTRLARRGTDVVALARRSVEVPGVEFVKGDIRDAETVAKAMAGCDAVAHLAWAVSPLKSVDDTRDINVGGTINVLEAMNRTGCSRIVFSSSVTAYGAWPDNPPLLKETDPLRPAPDLLYAAHKAECEELVLAGGADSVISRTCVVAGRHLDNYAFRIFAAPVLAAPKGELPAWQFIHEEDNGRFHADAILGSRTGIINVAAEGGVPLSEIAEILGRRFVSLPESVIRQVAELSWKYDLMENDPASLDGFRYMPVADTTRLREEWGFECAWTGREALEDLARSLSRVVYLGKRHIDLPWRLTYADTAVPHDLAPLDGEGLVSAAPPGLAGELDSHIDPRYPMYTATNLSEAFPGPMTPLSLTVSLDVMHASSDGMVDFLALEEPIARELRARGAASFGHRLYIGLSPVREMAEHMPGMSAEDIDEQYLGIQRPERAGKARPTLGEALEAIRLLGHAGPRIAGFRREVDRSYRESLELVRTAGELAAMDDPRLLAHISLVHDQLAQAWNVSCIGNMVAGGVLGAAQRLGGGNQGAAARAALEPLASASALEGVQRLAAVARADSELAALLRAEPAADARARLTKVAPAFARDFEDLVATCGHRGPGETELENATFADAPELLLDAIAKSLDTPARPAVAAPVGRRGQFATRAVARAMRTRERGRDAAMRLTHALRLGVRERGRRLAASGVLDDPADVFYLTYGELLDPPEDAAARVPGRRAERERLAGLHLPTIFEGRWEPLAVDTVAAAGVGDTLSGQGASPGVVQAPVRVLREVGDVIEPGEILVAHVTDTGWTPLFAFAAAVVTDIGGQLSHPAVVAREYGIPCVVGTGTATASLRDGQLVEVDGAAGTVRVVE